MYRKPRAELIEWLHGINRDHGRPDCGPNCICNRPDPADGWTPPPGFDPEPKPDARPVPVRYQERDGYFFAHPKAFQDWPYANRDAICTRIDNAWFRNEPIYRFKVNGQMWEIARERAMELAKRWHFNDKKDRPWDLLPIAECTAVGTPEMPPAKGAAPERQNKLFN